MFWTESWANREIFGTQSHVLIKRKGRSSICNSRQIVFSARSRTNPDQWTVAKRRRARCLPVLRGARARPERIGRMRWRFLSNSKNSEKGATLQRARKRSLVSCSAARSGNSNRDKSKSVKASQLPGGSLKDPFLACCHGHIGRGNNSPCLDFR